MSSYFRIALKSYALHLKRRSLGRRVKNKVISYRAKMNSFFSTIKIEKKHGVNYIHSIRGSGQKELSFIDNICKMCFISEFEKQLLL